MITITNYSDLPYTGWVRATYDHEDGGAGPRVVHLKDGDREAKAILVCGRCIGRDVTVADLWVSELPARATMRGEASGTAPWTPGAMDEHWLFKAGTPYVGGIPLALRHSEQDGAAVLQHWSAHVGPMLHADLWVWGYPDMPGVARAELVITASDPLVPSVETVTPQDGLLLQWVGAFVAGDGGVQVGIPGGQTMADGQARAFALSIVWPAMVKDASAAHSLAEQRVQMVGVNDLYVDHPGTWKDDAIAFVQKHLPKCQAALAGWDIGPLGVAKDSGQTGAQEDQLFVGQEGTHLAGGILPRYYAALGQFRRPCHHLEGNGEVLSRQTHPRLVMWDSRPHWHTGVSPDQLGKVGRPTKTQTRGWWGPDEEHWIQGTVFAAARLTGSPALQRQLEHIATNWIYQKTVDPRASTSRPGAARAVGYEGYTAWQLFNSLSDSILAEDVLNRWEERVGQVILPKLRPKGDIWDIRKDDPRLGTGEWWMPWQQGLGAWGLYIGCELIGHDEGMEFAVQAAERVVRDAYYQDGGTWKVWYALSPDGRKQAGSSDWTDFGAPLAVATVLRSGKADDRTMQIAKAHLETGSGKWTDPGLLIF